MSGAERQKPIADRWILLIHQLPAKPAYLRVKIWRRLQALGAVPVKNSVYALPAGPEAQEDFEWLVGEIVGNGGEAFVCEARMIDGLTDGEVRTMFNGARDSDYETLARDARALAKLRGRWRAPEARSEAKAQLGRLKARLDHIAAIDFFGADSRETVAGLLAEIDGSLGDPAPHASKESPEVRPDGLAARVWVTRTGVHVDRIATAWLVRRFIDADATFKFVPSRGYKPNPGELRFDMVGAEFTHVGDRCTFEVLLPRVALDDPGLRAIAEIVHDIDLKDGKFARPQTEGIKTLITGLCMATQDDEERIRRGSAVFDDLYQYFRKVRV